jgi:hypothetical protein
MKLVAGNSNRPLAEGDRGLPQDTARQMHRPAASRTWKSSVEVQENVRGEGRVRHSSRPRRPPTTT